MAKYRKDIKDFQLQAAKLVTEQGYSYGNAAKRLGTTGWSIRNWVRKFRQSGELPAQIDTQPKACRDDSNAVLVRTVDLTRSGSGGLAHFDADGMLKLGSRFADARNRQLVEQGN